MLVDGKQAMSGAVLAAIGILYGGTGLRTLPLGEVFNMGPGFFPMMLSGMLVIIGGVLIVGSLRSPVQSQPVSIPWRPLVLLSGAVIFFAMSLSYIGLLPAVFVSALLACYADRNARLRSAALTSAVIAAFCVVVFVYALRTPIPVFGTLLLGRV